MELARPCIYFRADGNARIGLGHFVRSLALAQLLAPRFAAVLVMREPDEAARQQIAEAGAALLEVPTGLTMPEAEAGWLAAQLQPADLLVLDGYGFDEKYQRVLSGRQFGLACIDDLITAPTWADLVINQAGGVPPTAYAAVPGAQLCLGPGFALLRQPFQALPTAPAVPGGVFLSMGGADPGNQTAALLPELLQRFPQQYIEVVTGAAYPYQEQLQALAAPYPTVRLHHNLTAAALREVLDRCTVRVCPPSGLAYECCATGGLLLLHRTADNQQAMFDFLVNNGLALPYDQLAITTDANLPALATAHRTRQRQLFDGQAGARLLVAFAELHATAGLHLREATAADCRQYFDWANDADVRRNAIQQDPIPWPVHEAWFARRLADPDTYLFIAESKGRLLGQVRIEFAAHVGTIDYSVAATERGKGLGRALLRRAIHRLRHARPGPWTLRGEVKASNPASARVFEALRFTRVAPVLHMGQPFEVFELAVNSGLGEARGV